MEEVLQRLCTQEKEITSAGTTLVQTEQLLKDLETLDKQAQVTNTHTHTHTRTQTHANKSIESTSNYDHVTFAEQQP